MLHLSFDGCAGNDLFDEFTPSGSAFICFAILADETMDVSMSEQMCLAFCWANDLNDIFEEPVGLYNVPKPDGATLF